MIKQNHTPINVESKSKQSLLSGIPSQQVALRPTRDVLTISQTQELVDQKKINEFAELRELVGQRGLLDKQQFYYTHKILSTLVLLALSLTILALVDTTWMQLINAGFLGFVFAQIGFIGHDAGHRQIYRSVRNNEIIGLVICFLLALDRSWWIDKHNRHHSNPNNLALDPDADLPVVAFTKRQALAKKGFYRLIVKYQAFLFYPMLLLEGLGLRLAGVLYLLHNKIKYPRAEPLLMIGHFAVYFSLLFFFLSAWQAVLFFLIHQAVFGFIVGSVFAPNHKGMLIIGENEELDLVRRQVLTSRNVKAHPLTDFLYAGLNYQIEHHLFPNMPRNKLRKAQKVVKAFCKEHSIPYYETGLIQSHKEILQYLHQESAPLRSGKD